jgi:hypothetical protein
MPPNGRRLARSINPGPRDISNPNFDPIQFPTKLSQFKQVSVAVPFGGGGRKRHQILAYGCCRYVAYRVGEFGKERGK